MKSQEIIIEKGVSCSNVGFRTWVVALYLLIYKLEERIQH